MIVHCFLVEYHLKDWISLTSVSKVGFTRNPNNSCRSAPLRAIIVPSATNANRPQGRAPTVCLKNFLFFITGNEE